MQPPRSTPIGSQDGFAADLDRQLGSSVRPDFIDLEFEAWWREHLETAASTHANKECARDAWIAAYERGLDVNY